MAINVDKHSFMLILLINIAVTWVIEVSRNIFLGRGRIYAQR